MLRLSETDSQVLEHLKVVRCLSLEQIARLIKRDPESYRRRLWSLTKDGYLKRLQYGKLGGVYSVIWTVGLKCEGAPRPYSFKHLYELEHQLGLNEIYVRALEDESLSKLILWKDGNLHPLGEGEQKIYPDAIAESTLTEARLFLEYDRSNKPIKRLEQQILAYKDWFSRSDANSKETLVFICLEKDVKRLKTVREIMDCNFGGRSLFGRTVAVSESIAPKVLSDFLKKGRWVEAEPVKESVRPERVTTVDVDLSVIRAYLEESVSIFLSRQIPIPESYKIAAKIVFKDGNRDTRI